MEQHHPTSPAAPAAATPKSSFVRGGYTNIPLGARDTSVINEIVDRLNTMTGTSWSRPDVVRQAVRMLAHHMGVPAEPVAPMIESVGRTGLPAAGASRA